MLWFKAQNQFCVSSKLHMLTNLNINGFFLTFWFSAIGFFRLIKSTKFTNRESRQPHPHIPENYGSFLTPMPQFQKLTFIRGIKGFPKIIFGGNGYYKHSTSRTCAKRTFWLCSKSRNKKCNARVWIDEKSREIMLKNQNHTHDPITFDTLSTDLVETYMVAEFD